VSAITEPDPAAAQRDDLARAALARYALPEARLCFVRHGENLTYQVTASDGRCFALRMHRPGYQTPAAIRSELTWMEALRASGLTTPVAVSATDGEQLTHIPDEHGDLLAVVLFEWIDGVSLSTFEGVAPWERLGWLLARIHAHGRGWTRPPDFVRPAWDLEALVGERPRWGEPLQREVFALDDRDLLARSRREVRHRLVALGNTSDRYGLIHGDLGFDNVLVTSNGGVAIIDFDDCGEGWFVHDIAVALYPHENRADLQNRLVALVAGYRHEGTLTDQMLAELPTFLMARRLATLGWVFSRPETEHARTLREARVRSSPDAARQFLRWSQSHPVSR
jgi:Ser/Thr protein kinase RdoA (MazF antagonist)